MIHVTHVFAEESLVTSHVNNVVNLSCKRMFYPIEQAVRFQGLTVVVFSLCPSITCHHFACRTIESSEVFDKRTKDKVGSEMLALAPGIPLDYEYFGLS